MTAKFAVQLKMSGHILKNVNFEAVFLIYFPMVKSHIAYHYVQNSYFYAFKS